MLEALKNSPEKKELVDTALKYLRGVKGALVQQKKRDREKAASAKGMINSDSGQMAMGSGGTRPSGPVTTGMPGPTGSTNVIGSAPVSYQPPYTPGAATTRAAIPGSVGSALMAMEMHQPMPAQEVNDQQVETALRGFLGRD